MEFILSNRTTSKTMSCSKASPSNIPSMVTCDVIHVAVNERLVCATCRRDWVDGLPPESPTPLLLKLLPATKASQIPQTVKTLADGSYIFPRDQRPPASVPYCDRDPRDPYHWIPAFVQCRHRKKHIGVRPCGAISVSWHCSLKQVGVNVPYCDECEVEPK